MSTMKSKLMLIDGNSVLYRAFFALPDLTTSGGMHTNAALGFTMMVLKLIDDIKPTHVLVAFDAGKKTFRHDKYIEYKGTRDKTPNELSGQFEIVREILSSLHLVSLQLENYEADDIIGTYSKRAAEMGIQTTIVSGDRDMMQLISDHVDLCVMSRKGVTEVDLYDVEKIQQRYGLTPQQMIDLKGLMGDSSDNIPGVPGVGEKTAIKLLTEYPSLEEVLAHIDQIPGKSLQAKLREHQNLALLSKELATIFREVPLENTIDTFKREPYHPKQLLTTFKKYEFKKLIERLRLEEKAYQESKSEDPMIAGVNDEDDFIANVSDGVEVISSNQQTTVVAPEIKGIRYETFTEMLFAFQDQLPSEGVVCLYISTRNEEGKHPQVEGIAIACSSFSGYVAFEEDLLRQVHHLHEEVSAWKCLAQLFLQENLEWVIPDAKATAVVVKHFGVEIPEKVLDPVLAYYLLNPADGDPDYRDLLESRLQWSIPPAPKASKRTSEDLQRMGEYLTFIAFGSVRIAKSLKMEMVEAGQWELYEKLELPLSQVLASMEFLGVRVDKQTLLDLGIEFRASLERLTATIYELAGTEFNINSPKQLGEVLFDKMGLPAEKKTKTGYSTSADVLERLAEYSPIVKNILEFRQVGKLVSTYVEGLLKVIREDGRIHTSFKQTITATGRLSSIDPNLQNIPIRLPEGRRLRKAFVPSFPGWKILSADYSQIELRILAHISGDENMRDAFIQQVDIHTRTAADVFGVPEDTVTSEMRRAAKAVNFGIVYGISDYGLSQNLNITRKQAGEFITNYFAKFSGVKHYMENIVEDAREKGYVTTLLQRRRHLPDIKAKNFNLRSFAERTAMNTPIQGTAADILKKAMVDVQKELLQKQFESRMLLTVHDELIFEGPESEMDILSELVRQKMEHTVELSVPLKVELQVGDTWYEAK